jgi:hypothetical protein
MATLFNSPAAVLKCPAAISRSTGVWHEESGSSLSRVLHRSPGIYFFTAVPDQVPVLEDGHGSTSPGNSRS